MKYEYLKGSEKDFEGAPEWAELIYFGDVKCFVGRDGRWKNESSNIIFNDFSACSIPARLGLIAERRPITEPEWDGVGLPPVGCVCEWQDNNTKQWTKVSIAYSSEWVTVIREDKIADAVEIAIENYGDEARRQFRHIRSEADKKRDETIESIMKLFNSPSQISATVNRLYDAIATGIIPGVKLED